MYREAGQDGASGSFTNHYRYLPGLKGAVLRYSVIFCAFFARGKWRLLTQASRTSDHDSWASHANNLTAEAESRKCRFPRAIVMFRDLALWPPLFFPHKMAAKNHRLSWRCRFKSSTMIIWGISSGKMKQKRRNTREKKEKLLKHQCTKKVYYITRKNMGEKEQGRP